MVKETLVQSPFSLNQTLEHPSVPGLDGFVRLSPEADDLADSLGPLADLVGTWIGSKGWNMIAVPQGNSFLLLVRPYIETVTFTPLGAPVPDRGGTAGELFIMGLEYSLRVSDAETNQPLHLENGMWLLLNQNQKKNPGVPSIARHSTIPHGDSVMALGDYSITKGAPKIADRSGMPEIGKPKFDGYLDQYISLPKGFDPTNVVSTLQDTLAAQKKAGQTIAQTTTLNVSTANFNGGILNIPFVVKNANASAFECVFWIETVNNPTKGANPTFQQLQYFQQTNLNFLPKFNEKGLIMWPHTNVNTLAKQ